MPGIEIHGDINDDFLSVSLKDVLACFTDVTKSVNWRLYFVEAWGSSNLPSIIDIERSVDASPNGIMVNFSQVQDIAESGFQIINLILIGSSDIDSLYIDNNYREMRDNYQYYIELFDSSFFIIYSHDRIFLDCLINNLGGIKKV